MNSSILLSARDLHLRRGPRELYGGLDLELGAGELLWLRGDNGAGKTTLLRILAGLTAADSGVLSWRGQTFASRLDEERQALAWLDERLGLARDLSVLENLEYARALASSEACVQAVVEDFDLGGLRDRQVRYLSTGQRKRTALARVFISRASAWLLDEPMNGLDATNRMRLGRHLNAHLLTGGAAIVASHDPIPGLDAPPREMLL